ncbi:MAG: phosphatase PAP2 family protein [Anaerolineales bacterium]|nr:phosphatase PAP2 family protein [Anaerolineales bacterium]
MNARFAHLDQRITTAQQRALSQSPHRLRAARLLAHSGDSIVCYAVYFLLYAAAPALWKVYALRLLLLITLNALPVVFLKYSFKRERPQGKWGAIYRRTDPHAFPSGHAARTFLIAVASLLSAPIGLGAVLLLWACCVSIARVGLALHYASDVILGALLGSLIGIAGTLVLL